MRRRRLLALLGVSVASASGCLSSGQSTTADEPPASTQTTETHTHRHTPTTDGTGAETTQTDAPNESAEGTQKPTERGDEYTPLTDHYHSDTVVYDHDELRLQAGEGPVRLGETIAFTTTNTGDSSIPLGCHNPTTIQKQVDGEWRDVVWTTADGYLTCATMLQAGHSTSEAVTITKGELESSTEEVRVELTPGQYRFVLLATDPYLAADFQVQAETAQQESQLPAVVQPRSLNSIS